MQLFGLPIKTKKMKKQLVMLAVIILIMLKPIYSQLVIHTNKCLSGVWDKYEKKYTYGNPKEVDIIFKVFNNHITVNDKVGSVYKMIRESKDIIESDYTIKGFDCKDEKDRDCNFSIIKYNDPEYPSVLIVIYESVAFMYFIKNFVNLD
jgi:hypothetical protein